MTKQYGTVRCSECGQDLTGKIQVYAEGKVFCEADNWRLGKLLQNK